MGKITEPTEKKQIKGRFKPGTSGNPAGRKRGSLNKCTLAAMALLRGEAVGITRVVVNAALAGDLTAIKICMERLIPTAKDAPFDCVLPKMKTIADLPKITESLLNAVSNCEIPPSEAEKIVKIVSGHIQALQLSEFEIRLSELENTAGVKRGGR